MGWMSVDAVVVGGGESRLRKKWMDDNDANDNDDDVQGKAQGTLNQIDGLDGPGGVDWVGIDLRCRLAEYLPRYC